MLEIGWNLRVSTPRSAFPGKATGRTENSFFRLGGSSAGLGRRGAAAGRARRWTWSGSLRTTVHRARLERERN